MSSIDAADEGAPVPLYGRPAFPYVPHAIDPLDDIAPSTVAMIILFGSLTFATVSMACRALVLGDKRAILAATSVKIKSPIPDMIPTNSRESRGGSVTDESIIGDSKSRVATVNANSSMSVISEMKDSLWGDDEDEDKKQSSNRSVTFSNQGNNATNMESPPQPWEPTFISTFVLFYQFTIFGMILFTIYLLDKHPPNGGFGSLSGRDLSRTYGLASEMGVSEFDEDQFIFWMIVVIVYGYFVSWRRNDGKPHDFNTHPSHRLVAQTGDDATVTSHSTKSGGGRSRRSRTSLGEKSGISRSRKDDASVGGDSSQGSNVSKRLEDVLLDDDEESKKPLEPIADKEGDEDEEVLCKVDPNQICVNLVGGRKMGVVAGVKQQDDVLNRCQTLEWRGFLSIALLIYQHNNAGVLRLASSDVGSSSETLADEISSEVIETNIYDSIYNSAMTSMIFLTGYNQATSLYFSKASRIGSLPPYYGIARVMDVIFRMNWTAIFLSLMLANSLQIYIACPLHTYYFLLIWSTMRLKHATNYSKYLFRLKLFIFACSIYFYWDLGFGLREVTNALAIIFGELFGGTVGGTVGFISEWDYNSYLHHWAAFIGVVYAINQPIASLQLRKLESLGKLPCFLAKGFIFGALGLVASYWAIGPLQLTNAYFGAIPFLCYIYLRNISDTLRARHIGGFSWVGVYSLEIYLLHNHVFASGRHLVIIPGLPRCSFILVTILLILAARTLHNVTTIIRQMLLPENDGAKCFQHISSISIGVIAMYVLARVLVWADVATVGTLATITIISGILLYQTVMDVTWAEYCASGSSKQKKRSKGSSAGAKDNTDADESRAALVSPPLIGTLCIFALGMGWHLWAFSSGAPPSSRMDMACSAYANDGLWIPVQVCSAFEKGKLQRNYNSQTFFGPAECSNLTETTQWAWPKSSNHCAFRYRSDIEVQRKLEGKRVMFIGDSSVRSLFFSVCRFMGDLDAGGFDSSFQSHSDSLKKFGSTTIEYKWAPLSVDVVTKLRNVKSSARGAFPRGKLPPALVVAGAGAFDKLHLALTDEDSQSERDVVTRLTTELKALNEIEISTVWLTPPAVNTRALNSDEKRNQMSEESIEDMRRVYAELGVESAVTFVLDGPSFTRERVAESFDGVHYPSSIYDAGAQILFNAFDWLMDGETLDDPYLVTRPQVPGNPFLGLMMLCFALIGLFFFDGYFGISYTAQIFVGGSTVSPSELYQDAYDPIFSRLKLNQSGKETGGINSDGSVGDHELSSLIGRSTSSTTSSLSRRR